MSKALDLLNSLTEEEIAQLVAQPEPEGYIVVAGDRTIRVPENLKRIAVQNDHNVETVSFRCPQYWDDQDLSNMVVYINYRLSNGYKDRYPAKNVSGVDGVLHFDWTISRNVTQVKGVVSFLVCAVKTDADGNEIVHWNSELNQEMYVSEGMECEESPIDTYPDIVNELLDRYMTAEQLQRFRDEAFAFLEATRSAEESAHATLLDVEDSAAEIRNSYANAVKGSVSGEVVRVDDVSPLEHDVKCWVHGKNLINVADVSYENYTGYHKPLALGFKAEIGKTYTLSMDVESSREPFVASIGFGSKDAYYVDGTYTSNLYNGRLYITFTPTENQVIRGAYLHVRAPRYSTSDTYSASISRIQLEYGPVATDYEAYVDPATVTVNKHGKNLARASYNYNVTSNGLNIVGTKDSSEITINGTSDKANSYRIMKYMVLGPGTYTASIVGANVVDSGNDRVYICNSDSGAVIVNHIMTDKPRSFSLSEVTSIDVEMVFAANSKYSYMPIRFQIERGSVATGYEPYTGSTVTPDVVDGTCTVKSVSPTMTLLTDTPGVIIEVEYNRDTTKLFESYVLTPETKTEIAALVEADMAEVLASLNSYATSLIGGGA